jgi:hypothetical protein
MAINAGVNVSKLVAYGVLAPMPGVNITKIAAYAVLASSNVSPPLWGTWAFAGGGVGFPYERGWDMPTSAEVVTYSVLSGALPDGLALDAIMGNQAHIHGTPTVMDTFIFTLRATNDYGTVDKEFSITIIAMPPRGGSYTFIA